MDELDAGPHVIVSRNTFVQSLPWTPPSVARFRSCSCGSERPAALKRVSVRNGYTTVMLRNIQSRRRPMELLDEFVSLGFGENEFRFIQVTESAVGLVRCTVHRFS